MTLVKNELPEEYASKMSSLKAVLVNSKLSANNMRQVELLLRDNGADYFKITKHAGQADLSFTTEFDLIWKYHGLTEDFIVYVDFD